MPRLVKYALKAGAGFPQATLQGTGTHVQITRNVFNRGAVPGQLVLNGAAHQFQKAVVVRRALLEFLLELRGEHFEQFGIASHKRKSRVTGTKDHGVTRFATEDRTAEKPLQGFDVCARLNQLNAQRSDPVPLP